MHPIDAAMLGGCVATLSTLALLGPAEPGGDQADSQALVRAIAQRAERAPAGSRRFYQRRAGAPVWTATTAQAGLETILAAEDEGLAPEDYGARKIAELIMKGSGSTAGRAKLEVELTTGLLALAAAAAEGRVDPWTGALRKHSTALIDQLGQRLEDALVRGAHPRELIAGLLPDRGAYLRLRTAYRSLRATLASGGWPEIPAGPALKPGDSGPRVAALRARLVASGDLRSEAVGEGERYDDALALALSRFQARHGLAPDGLAGRSTLAALAVSAEARAEQLALALERWRALPRALGPRHVWVNIPGYTADLVEGETSTLTMRAIVGKPKRPTPLLTSAITGVVAHPTWDVPYRIAAHDLLPLITKDPGYLAARGFHVRSVGGGEELDPASIDWASLAPGAFPYRLRQDAGPRNALGAIKLVFPNSHDVYLHGTPEPRLFDRASRALSSGCVRIEAPEALAERLLRSPEALSSALSVTRTQTLALPEAVPIHLVYFTAWVASDGSVQFRPDLYRHDARLHSRLRRTPRPPPPPPPDAFAGLVSLP